jgi:prepilin-type N-terminal cleavage/methylation domain
MQMKSAGFTIVELLASLAIASVVAGATVVTLVRQQRFYTRTADVIEVKSQLRDAAAVLTGDIRGAAVNAFGVPLMADSAVELFTTIGSSIVCAASAQQTFGLPPSVLVSGNTLTSLLVSPDTADLAEIYTSSATNPDSAGWETRRVSSFTSRSIAATCAPSSGFTSPADGSAGQPDTSSWYRAPYQMFGEALLYAF